MSKIKLFFLITQFYKGGAETALVNLFNNLNPQEYEIDFCILNQLKLARVESLQESIPKWVKVYSPASRRPMFISIMLELFIRIWQLITKKRLVLDKIKIAENKNYDWAFSYGEWVDFCIVAKHITAKNKAVWIHTDIDKSPTFNEKSLYEFNKQYNRYLFVSENSMKSAIARWPFLEEKSTIVHNVLNIEEIKNGAKEKIPKDIAERIKYPLFVSVGNLRVEKNYLRQAKAMRLLKKNGINISWVVVGSTFATKLLAEVERELEKEGLNEHFIFVGADANPYKYMNIAKAVCNFSDYESWSLVITEALILGKPVIATATSGAMQQLQNGKNGYITGFTAEEIAGTIELFIKEETMLEKNTDKSKLGQGAEEFIFLVRGN